MKITKLETFHVKPRWLFLKISTDEGIVGWGEPIVEGRSKVVEAAVHDFGKRLIGENPCEIERLWQLMYRGGFYRGGPIAMSAISGIEQALWDIKGKFYNMPVYEMLGGKVRDKIHVYPHLDGDYPNTGDSSAKHLVKCALKRKAEGYDFVKLGLPNDPTMFLETPKALDEIVDKYQQIRNAVGDDMDIAVDCHGRLSPALAIKFCKAMESVNPVFIEEPVLPENIDVMVKVAESTTIPIATGERLYTRFGFKDLIEKQGVSIIQPDCCHAGGIFELRKIAAMAETYYMGFAPHNPLGPISLAACLQVDACTPNFVIQEFPCMDNGWDRGKLYLDKAFEIVNGYIDVPKGPGLGISINEEALKEMAYDGEWQSPLFSNPHDGSLVDW